MIEKISLKKNYIMNIILTMSSFIYPLLVFPYISRILLPVGTGKVSFATSIIAYFNMFAQLGIPTYGIRACAKVRDNKYELSKTFQEIFIINIFTCIVSYIFFVVLLYNLPKLNEERQLYLLISSTIILNSLGIEWLYKALEMYTYITMRSIMFKIIAFGLMLVLVQTSEDYVIYGGLTVFASSASNILNLINSRKYIACKNIKEKKYKYHFKSILVFFAMTCATTIYINLDMIMLGILKNDVEVGYYDAAVKVKKILVSIITSLGTVLLPRVSYYVGKRMNKEFREVNSKALNYVIVVAVPLVCFFIMYAEFCIRFIAGEAYLNSVAPMKIIMPAILFIGLSNILGIQMLVPLGKERIVLYSEIAGAITNIIFNSIYIPTYGACGAAFGTVMAEFVVMLFQGVYLWKEIVNSLRKIQYGKIVFAVFIAIIPCMYIKNLAINILSTLVISACCFFGIYVIILCVLKENLIYSIKNNFDNKIKNNGKGL